MDISRALRWGIALLLVGIIIWVWRTFEFGFAMLFTVILGVFVGVSIASDVTGFFAKLFVGTILDDEAKFDQVPPTYGTARTLAAQERWVEAIEAYRNVLVRFPRDLVAQQAIAEIYLEKLGDLEHGTLEYNQLLMFPLEDSARVTILLRLADVYEQRYNHPAYAAQCLAEIVHRFPNTKYAFAAAQRLAELNRRYAGGNG